jgi:predicted dehydrogenase
MTGTARGRESKGWSRRAFLCRGAAALAASGGLGIARSAHAAGGDLIRLAFIGCGGRGTGAAAQALGTAGPVKLVAMADVFPDRIENSLRLLLGDESIRGRIDVPPERRFTGFDAYRRAMDCGVDLVILTTPPHFRPIHYPAAVAAGKHVYMEKPVAVDAPGVRAVMAANQAAKARGLAVAVGFQRRHQTDCRESVKRIHDGAIGRLRYLRTYYLMSGIVEGPTRRAGETEMEYQLRQWNYFTWLSGDHFVEQSVHAVDVANWIAGAHPVKAQALGGRQVRTGPGTGQIFDHGAVEYEYPGGCRLFAFARQSPGCYEHVGQYAHGTEGDQPVGVGLAGVMGVAPGLRNPYQLQHDRLFAAIRGSQPFFEGDYGATSAMTAILGRMALYSGREVTWDEGLHSKLSLAPARYALDADPPVMPDKAGRYPVAMPGATVAW